MTERRRALTRRQVLGVALGLAGMRVLAAPDSPPMNTELCRDDVAISDTTALLFSEHAPLTPADGLRDARAVWTHVPPRSDRLALVFLHGNNNYVTVDASGHSRVPDWAAGDPTACAGASAKPAAPLGYALDRMGTAKNGPRPIVLLPEVGTLGTGAFWSREPAGQYKDPARLGALLDDCLTHLTGLHRPSGSPYLSQDFVRRGLARVLLSGHSGAGLILQEAAVANLIRPDGGIPADLCLLDCTYWSEVTGFIEFCRRWHTAGRLAGGRSDASRFVCVYRPKTQTEEIADFLRTEIAGVLGVPADTLVRDHTATNFESDIRPALHPSGVLFLRTYLPHDLIPTFFLPVLA